VGECAVGCYVLGVNIDLNLNFIAYHDVVTGLCYCLIFAVDCTVPRRVRVSLVLCGGSVGSLAVLPAF
jgi:hypothetical protein